MFWHLLGDCSPHLPHTTIMFFLGTNLMMVHYWGQLIDALFKGVHVLSYIYLPAYLIVTGSPTNFLSPSFQDYGNVVNNNTPAPFLESRLSDFYPKSARVFQRGYSHISRCLKKFVRNSKLSLKFSIPLLVRLMEILAKESSFACQLRL